MNAVVVYESVYGNTRQIAHAIADGLGGAAVVPVHEAAAHGTEVDLLVVGGPTHMHGLATARSRQMAAAAAHEDGGAAVEAAATGDPGLRQWLHGLTEVIGSESFLVEDSEGPLEDGELDRARVWGAELAASTTTTGPIHDEVMT